MPPPLTSSTRSEPGQFAWTCALDFTNLGTLPEQFMYDFEHALIFHMGDAAQRVIDTARSYLTRLEEPAVKVNPYGKEIHGYDTGVMYVTLRYQLAYALLVTGVYYELLSDEAKYWRYVEFGFTKANGDWWPGYHFLETAVMANEGYIRQQIREAWADACIRSAMEARKAGAVGILGLTSNAGQL